MPVLEIPSPSLIEDSLAGGHSDYFATPELTQRLNLIRHLIQHSGQLLLVLAEAGCGKTALLTRLRDGASDHWWIHNPTVTPTMSPDALASSVLNAFKVRHDGKSSQALQESLRSHLAAARYNGQLPVLLVDDAHVLPLATLKLLIEFAMQGEPLTRMRVVLFCEPQVTSILAIPEFDLIHNALIHTLDIPPLNRAQIQGYIQNRLQEKYYHYSHLFTHEVLRRIYQQSAGIPARINPIIEQIVQKFAEQWPKQPPRVKRGPAYSKSMLIAGFLLVILLMGAVLAMREFYPSLFQKAVENPHAGTLYPLQKTPALEENEVPQSLPELLSEENFEDPQRLEAFGIEKEITNVPLSLLTPKQSELTPPAEDVRLFGETVKREPWIFQQSPTAYTLQILGTHDPTTLKNFFVQNLLKEDALAVFKTSRQRRDWYVLIYGSYPSRDHALTALSMLPSTLKQTTQPWPRVFADVQALIK